VAAAIAERVPQAGQHIGTKSNIGAVPTAQGAEHPGECLGVTAAQQRDQIGVALWVGFERVRPGAMSRHSRLPENWDKTV
jgi:hypothetical protein